MLNKLYYNIKRVLFEIPARNNLIVRKSDIFLVSYPRSGNTWLRFVLGTYISDKKVDWLNLERIFPDMYRCSEKFLNSLPNPRYIKSHHPYDKRFNKVIYVVRDPRDVVISYYYWNVKFNNFEDTQENFDEFFEDFVTGRIRDFGTWSHNVESWINKCSANGEKFFLLRYEDLKTNTREIIVDILTFLGEPISVKRLDKVLEWTSMSNMKALEVAQRDKSDLLETTNKSYNFVGSGDSGKVRKKLSRIQLNRLNNNFKETMIKFGYE